MRKILSSIVLAALFLLPQMLQAQNVTVTLSVSDNTKGAVTVPGPGTYTLDADEDSLVVTWTANSGYIIDGIERVWTSSGYIFVDTIPWIDHSITYVIGPHSPYNAGDSYVYTALLVPDSVTFTLAVNDPTMGTTNPVPGAYRYANGDTARFTAVPNAGYELQGWIIGQTSSWGTTSYDTFPSYGYNNYVEYVNVSFIGRMYGHDWTYTALFAPVSTEVEITVRSEADGAGTVSGGGIYNIGDQVTVTATANPFFIFDRWTDWFGQTLSYDNPYTFTATEDVVLVAHFLETEPDTATIIIGVNDASLGTTDPAPGVHQYITTGDIVTITAIPNEGNSFVRWTDEDGFTISTTNSLTLGLYSSYTLTLIANFVEGEYVPDSVTLTVAVNNPSMGTTTPAPGTFTFAENAMVQFLATPYDGYFVMGWELQANYMGMTIRDTLFGENEFSTDFFDLVDVTGIVLTALFTDDDAYDYSRVGFTFNTISPEMGTTDPAPGNYTYHDGDTITLTAIPNDGYRLVDWTLSVTMYGQTYTEPLGEPLTTLTFPVFADEGMGSYTITAIFAPDNVSPDSLTVAVGVDYPHRGTVTPVAGNYNYAAGETVTVTATANSGYYLNGWHVTISHPVYGIIQDETIDVTNPTISFEVEEDMLGYVHTIVARFGAPEGIEDIDVAHVNVYGSEGSIVLTGAEGREVRVYDISGRQLHHSRSAHATESYGVPATGIYLIKVAGVETKRVVVVR